MPDASGARKGHMTGNKLIVRGATQVTFILHYLFSIFAMKLFLVRGTFK